MWGKHLQHVRRAFWQTKIWLSSHAAQQGMIMIMDGRTVTLILILPGGPIVSEVGGSLWYLEGCIRSFSKLKNIPKALIPGQKRTLIFKNADIFSSKKTHPSFIKTMTLDERILTLDFIILCLISGSRLGSLVTSGVTRVRAGDILWILRGFSAPLLRNLVQNM